MELYHWYKGTELPTEECDCVVICKYTQEFVNNNPDDDDVFTKIDRKITVFRLEYECL